MSKSNEFALLIMQHIFENAAIPNLGDATGLQASGGPGDLYVSLHTSDPGEAVTDPTTTETSYTDYARISVSRSGQTGWTVTGGDPASCSPTADIDFPECGVTPGADLTHFAILGGITNDLLDQVVLYSGTLTPDIVMAEGVIPRIKTTSTITED
jgi:hypothetical protein